MPDSATDTIFADMRRLTVFCTFLLLTLSLAGQAPRKAIQAELESRYKGQIVRMKASVPGTLIHFDGAGAPKSRPDPCVSWTLCNVLAVTKISVTDHSLKVEGERIGVGFADGKQKYYGLRDQLVGIEIDLDGEPDLTKANTALCKVFVCSKDNFADHLPYAWARYFDPQTKVPSPAVTISDKDAKQVDAAVKRLRVSQGVQASKLISQPKPTYPEIAKAYRQQGSVTMRALIARDGTIRDIYFTSPAGFGLDEAALEAVRKWIYQPTTLKGEPVEVETTIIVNFTLERR